MPRPMKTVLLIYLLVGLLPAVGSAQTCNPSILATTTHLIDNGDGTVSDSKTGLMWKKCSEGQNGTDCSGGSTANYTWKGALELAQTVNNSGGFAGKMNWRLPNIKELRSITERQCYAPAINLTVFPNTSAAVFLSSSPSSYNNVWYYSFHDGNSGSGAPMSSYDRVRLVRDGP